MKRSFLYVLCVALLFVTACNFTMDKKPVAEHFSCRFTATYGQMQLGGTIQREGNGTMKMTLSQPPSLSGLVCRLNGEDFSLSLGDLEYKTEVLPVVAAPRLLREVLDTLRYADEDSVEGDMATYTGTVGTYTFTAFVSKENGYIQTISVPDANMEIQFTEVAKAEE